MFENQSTQNRAREKRREQGYSKNLLCVGDYIAYEPNYTAETRAEGKQDFWVGKILSLDKQTREVEIQLWHTPTKGNGADSRNGCVYTPWKGNRSSRQTAEFIRMSRVYESFPLTANCRVKKKHVTYVMTAKNLRRLDEQPDCDSGDCSSWRAKAG